MQKRKICNRSVIYIMISIIYLSIFSSSTSPFYNHAYRQDASIFLLLGKAVAKGLVPYVDIYDHKGPILFFIQAPGWIMTENGIWFVFLLQIISLFVSLYFGHKIARLFVSEKLAYRINLIAMLFVIATVGSGNTNEEFCLPWIVVSIYTVLNIIMKKSRTSKERFVTMFFLGISFAFCCLIRMNNAAPIAGLVAYLFLEDCFEKEFARLVKDGLWGLAGIAVISIPFVVYLYMAGALKAMWNAAFTYNFGVVATYSGNTLFPTFLKSFPIFFLGIISLLFMKNNKKAGSCLFITTVVSLPALMVGSGYWHYFVLIAWYVPIGISVLYAMEIKKKSLNYFLLLFACVCCLLYGRNVVMNAGYTMKDMFQAEERYLTRNRELKDLIESVPEEEQGQIFTYNAEAEYYLETETLPNYKYFTLQSSMSRVDESINQQWNEEFLDRQPKWVVWNAGKACSNFELMEILNSQYELRGIFDTYYLYEITDIK